MYVQIQHYLKNDLKYKHSPGATGTLAGVVSIEDITVYYSTYVRTYVRTRVPGPGIVNVLLNMLPYGMVHIHTKWYLLPVVWQYQLQYGIAPQAAGLSAD